MATTAEFSQLSNAAYAGGQIPAGWAVADSHFDAASGFHATAFRNQATGEIVVSYRGTDNISRDYEAYRAILGTGPSRQFDQALDFFNRVKEQNPTSAISLTGHSLGGALAQFVATRDSISAAPRISETVTFGAPGVSASTLGVDPATFTGLVTNYVFGNDPVGQILPNSRVGNTVVLNDPSW